MHRFRLIDESGNDLGPLATHRDHWVAGERVSRWHGDELEVVRLVEAGEEAGLFEAYIVVKTVGLGRVRCP